MGKSETLVLTQKFIVIKDEEIVRTDENDIDATRSERTSFSCPSKTVLENPRVEVVFLFLSKTKAWVCDTL